MFLGQNFDLEAFYTIIFNPFQDVLLQDFFTNRQVSDEYLTHYMRFTLHQLFVSPTQIFLYLYFRKYNIWQQTYLVISTAVIMWPRRDWQVVPSGYRKGDNIQIFFISSKILFNASSSPSLRPPSAHEQLPGKTKCPLHCLGRPASKSWRLCRCQSRGRWGASDVHPQSWQGGCETLQISCVPVVLTLLEVRGKCEHLLSWGDAAWCLSQLMSKTPFAIPVAHLSSQVGGGWLH